MGAFMDAIVRGQELSDPYVEGVSAANEELEASTDVTFFEFHGVELDRCVLSRVVFSKASFYDCTFTGCDFSNAHMEEAYFARCALVGCKLEGAQLTKAFLRSTRLVDCMCRYGNWGESTLEGAALVDCDLRESFLNEVRLRKKTRLERCDLTRADFFRTSLRGVDLSTCAIAGIGTSDTRAELRGALISAEQAVDLVGMLGVRVVDYE